MISSNLQAEPGRVIPDDRLGQADDHVDLGIDPAKQDNRAKDRAGQAALRELMRPAAAALNLGRLLAVLSAVLAIAPYVALVQLGALLLAAWPGTGGELDRDALWFWVMVLAGAFGARVGLYAIALAVTHFADATVRVHIHRLLLDRLARAPLSWFTSTNSGRIRKAIQDDAVMLHMLIAHAPVETTSAVATPLALLVYAIVIDWRLGLFSVAVFPLYLGYYAIMMRGMAEKTAEMDTRLDLISATMVEFVAGITVVKAFGRVGRAHRRFARAAEEFAEFYLAWASPLMKGSAISRSIVSTAVLLSVNLGGGYLMMRAGWVSAVEVLTTTLIALLLPNALIVLSNGLWAYQLAGGAALRIVQTLDTPQLAEPANPKSPAGHEVRFEHVSFSYDDVLAVDDVSLTLPEGSVTALVGHSGSGKSTLASLVARFSDVDSGAVTIGGVDVREMTTAELYRTVAFVLQDAQLLRTSIRANIALGRPDATDEQIRAVARAAQIDEYIESLPDGYDTVIGEQSDLSGGQAQRVAIARALLVDAPVLLLDEATAFTDPDCEAEIQQALSRLVVGRTVLVIAHRPASIVGADRIVVLDRGRMIAAGSHEELAGEPHYRQIWQLSGQAVEPAAGGAATAEPAGDTAPAPEPGTTGSPAARPENDAESSGKDGGPAGDPGSGDRPAAEASAADTATTTGEEN